jgi:chemotaxis protein histidine kinase CheA
LQVVCVGPSVNYHSETTNTIKFGQRAIKIENSLRRRELVDYKALCRMQMEQLDLLTSALENAELARESAEEDANAMQAMIDKESDIEAQRTDEMKRLTEALEAKQREFEVEKGKHKMDLQKSQAQLQDQLTQLQTEIGQQQEEAAKAQVEANEKVKAARQKAEEVAKASGSKVVEKIVEVEKVQDPKVLQREKKLENVLIILQRELIDLKGKIDDMEVKHKQEVTACHQSWQQRLMYELKAKDKQIEYLQKTLEGCKAALTSKSADGAKQKGGRSFIDKMLGALCRSCFSWGGRESERAWIPYSDAKVANRNVRDFGWEVAHAVVSRRPPISCYAIVARYHVYMCAARFWNSSSFKGHFLFAPCQTLVGWFSLSQLPLCAHSPPRHGWCGVQGARAMGWLSSRPSTCGCRPCSTPQ